MKSWIFIIFLNWNECWQMKNQEMAETGKTARLPLCETYVLALWKNKEKEIPQIAAHRWLFTHPKLPPRSSPAAHSLSSAQASITEMTLLLPVGNAGLWWMHRAVTDTREGLGGLWDEQLLLLTVGWAIQTTAMNTGQVFVIPEEETLGGVLQPEKMEMSSPSLQSLVLGLFSPIHKPNS